MAGDRERDALTDVGPAWLQTRSSTLRWTVYLLVSVGGAIGTAYAITAVFDAELSGIWLVAVFLVPVVVSTLVVWLLARRYDELLIDLHEDVEALGDKLGEVLDAEQSSRLTLKVAQRLNEEISAFYKQDLTRDDLLRFIGLACEGLRDSYVHSGLVEEVRVCVKQVEGDFVTDFYRTNEVVDIENPARHAIDANTDFRQLVRNEKKVWFTGKRSEYPDYVTSSVAPTYESVIVWPIKGRRTSSTVDLARQPIRAFLCLDCDDEEAFVVDRDVPLGWTVADALARAYENAGDLGRK